MVGHLLQDRVGSFDAFYTSGYSLVDHMQHTLLVLLCLVVLDQLSEQRSLFRGQWLRHCGGRAGRVRSGNGARCDSALHPNTLVEAGPSRIGDAQKARIGDYTDRSISRRQAVNVGSEWLGDTLGGVVGELEFQTCGCGRPTANLAPAARAECGTRYTVFMSMSPHLLTFQGGGPR